MSKASRVRWYQQRHHQDSSARALPSFVQVAEHRREESGVHVRPELELPAPDAKHPAEVHFKLVLVTPELAAQWLERNRINCTPSPAVVARYAWDMSHERWDLTEEPIAFDSDGYLVQGQHRLMAVVKSGVSVSFYLAENAPGIWATRDRGYSRRAGHFLRWSEGEHADDPRLGAALNCLALLVTYSTHTVFHAFLQELLLAHEQGFRWALGALPARVFPAVAAALAYAYPVCPHQVEAFAEDFVSGVGLERGSPALALRQTIPPRAPQKEGKRSLMLRTFMALRAFVNDKPIARVEAIESARVFFEEWRQQKGLP